MKFDPTPLTDAWLITLDPIGDQRGYFARTYCRREFAAHGIEFDVVQCNSSFNREVGTLRGMHYQSEPFAEPKLVRCVQGALYDVIVDMRPESPSHMQHFGVELSPEKMNMLFIPSGFAHGFLTIKNNTEVFYMMGQYYAPDYTGGWRYDDPKLAIDWPGPINVLNEKDRNWPLM